MFREGAEFHPGRDTGICRAGAVRQGKTIDAGLRCVWAGTDHGSDAGNGRAEYLERKRAKASAHFARLYANGQEEAGTGYEEVSGGDEGRGREECFPNHTILVLKNLRE